MKLSDADTRDSNARSLRASGLASGSAGTTGAMIGSFGISSSDKHRKHPLQSLHVHFPFHASGLGMHQSSHGERGWGAIGGGVGIVAGGGEGDGADGGIDGNGDGGRGIEGGLGDSCMVCCGTAVLLCACELPASVGACAGAKSDGDAVSTMPSPMTMAAVLEHATAALSLRLVVWA